MKKSLLCSLFFLAFYTALQATHIVGGSMFHKYLGNNVWEIQLDMYRDCDNGEPYFDSEAAIGVFDEMGALVQNFYAPFNPMMDDTFDIANVPVCFPLPYPVCVHRGRYVFNVELPNTPGKTYSVVYQRCCRNELVQNIDSPLDIGMTFMTDITPSDENTSAYLRNPLPFYAFMNQPFVYDAGANDANADSLVYRLSNVVNGTDWYLNPFGFHSLPNPPELATVFDIPYSANYGVDKILGDSPNPLIINAQTGEMTALPTVEGYFVIGYEIDEYRNGALLASNHHEIMLVVNQGNYQPFISGNVYVQNVNASGTALMDDATIDLIQRNPINDSLLLIADTQLDLGAYIFSNVFTSKYYVRAIPNPNSAYYFTTFPTYHPNNFFWYDATEVEICNGSAPNTNINMISDSSYAPFGPEDDAYILGKLLNPVTKQPIANFELWLVDYLQRPLKWMKTDANGEFSFKNISKRDYFLYANEPNSEILNVYPVRMELATLNGAGISVVLERETDRLTLKSRKALTNPVPIDAAFYPNPTNNEITMTQVSGFINVTLYDVAGKWQQTETKPQFSIKNLPQGVYWMKVTTVHGVQLLKVLKM
jgi:hypothetical protein